MNKKISLGVCISLIAIACTVTFVVTWTVSLNIYNESLPGAQERGGISAKYHEIDSFVRINFRGDFNEADVTYGMFSGYMEALGDRNTFYMTAQEHRQHANEESGRIISTGLRVEREGSGYLTVAEVYPNSSAERAGIIPGDTIIAINGRDFVRDTNSPQRLEGDESEPVTVTIQREGEPAVLSLIRESFEIISVEADVVNEIGFIRISSFNALTASQFSSALQMSVNANVRALLIDLRDNSSGFYTPVAAMSNSLIGANTIAQTIHRGDAPRDFITTDNTHVFPEEMRDIPIVILINSQTSGAGELLAAILHHHAHAQLMGTPTAGNTDLQQTYKLKDGSAIRVTVARIVLTGVADYAGSGLVPEQHPVEMDSPVSYSISELHGKELFEIADAQIQQAFRIIYSHTGTIN